MKGIWAVLSEFFLYQYELDHHNKQQL